MWSLQRRVIFGGLIWAAIATVIGAFALVTVFSQIADRRFNEALKEQHTQLLVAFANTNSLEAIESYVNLPAFERTYSGRYWQIGNRDSRFTSASLFDRELPMRGKPGFWEGQGPQGLIRGYTEVVIGANDTQWEVTVATSLSALAAERTEMRRNATLAFSFVSVFGVACAALLTTLLLAPLRKLKEDVVRRWDTGKPLEPDDYPSEVAPLVADINELIQRNRNIHDRGRRQAADLAHALKTPSAALRNELVELSRKVSGTEGLFESLDRIDSQILRSLARMRAVSASEAIGVTTNAQTSVSRLERLFRMSPETSDKTFDVVSLDVNIAIDQQDFEEMLGNLLDNAFKWCNSAVSLVVTKADRGITVTIEDDGPGIDAAQMETVLEEGARLDTSVPGTGLGLSIVNDLSQAYGGALELSVSERLGGLKCTLHLKNAPGASKTAEAQIA
jgi:signal transduction histidine kinase